MKESDRIREEIRVAMLFSGDNSQADRRIDDLYKELEEAEKKERERITKYTRPNHW